MFKVKASAEINSIGQTFLQRTSIVSVCIALMLSVQVASGGNPKPTPTPTPPDGDFGNGNTAEGTRALAGLTTGANNTANGYESLISNTTGTDNTATGFSSLRSNTVGVENTANGFFSLYNNTADGNTATGFQSLTTNTTGYSNTAEGVNALFLNTTGFANTASGWNVLSSNTSGSNNIALGYSAGSNLIIGSYNIDIGNTGVADESGAIRIGTAGNQTATFVAGISGVPVAGLAVVVDGNGQLGTIASSERFKNEIKPMNKSSAAIFDLKPVTFRYKNELDPQQLPQFGLVAEEVEKVDPDLVARDRNGKVYTVRYEAVNAMLLNEFLKEHRRVEELETAVKQLQSTVAEQQKSSRKKAR